MGGAGAGGAMGGGAGGMGGGGFADVGAHFGGDGSGFEDVVAASTGLEYICGNCGFRQSVKKLQTIRCVACGYRILYKARTKRLVQFEAR